MRARTVSVLMTFLLAVPLCASSPTATPVRLTSFAEVEITLGEEFTLAAAKALPLAPGSEVQILGDGKAVKLQVPTEELALLERAQVSYKVLRKLLVVTPVPNREEITDNPGTTTGEAILSSCSGAFVYGDYDENIPLPSYSGLDFSAFPYVAVTCIDVHYEVIGSGIGYLYINLYNEDESLEYVLQDGVESGDISETEYGIEYFNGEPLNQIWWLFADEEYGIGGGYIDYWWIKLYYESGGGYCSASGGCDDYISRVQVGSIDNSTACTSYGDYTGLSTAMGIGAGYSITVTNGLAQYTTDECGIWVDWNQDEDFYDADEQIAVSGSPGIGPYTATITPPSGASLGDSRMRVRVIDGAFDELDACGSSQYGEVEDYTITVTTGGGYCAAQSSNCDYEYISRVQFDTINKSSGCDGYADYTSISNQMMPLDTEFITVTNGNPDPTDECGIWIDWNQDEDFDDTGETISVIGSPGNGPYFAAVTPSFNVSTGDTRMRVRITYGQAPTPCGTHTYGEVEDYTITIGAPLRIGGHVLTNWGDPMPDINVAAATGESDFTDANGYYELLVQGPFQHCIKVTSQSIYWTFEPYQYCLLATEDRFDIDFTGNYIGDPEPVMSGCVKTNEGYPIKDVLVEADPGESTYTDSDGYYELTVSSGTPLPEPWVGTITPSKDHWFFVPPNWPVYGAIVDVNGLDFTGTYTADPTPKITGYVKTPQGQPVKGVQIAADGPGGSAMTDASGFYELELFGFVPNVPRPYDGNVTPFKTDWSFSPPNNVYTDLAFDIHDQDYTASYIGAGCDNGWVEEWVARYNGDNIDSLLDVLKDMGVDQSGNIYVTGWSYNSQTRWDYALAKYDPNGELLWTARYGQPVGDDQDAEALAVDGLGNVYVTGHTETNDSYGHHNNCTTLRYPPDSNIPDWIAVYDGPDHKGDLGVDVATDAQGFVYVLCDSYDTSTRNDIVTIKYSPDDNIPLWTARYNGPENDNDDAEGIAVDRLGNVYVAGTSHSDTTEDDFVTIKYSPDGNELWAKTLNGTDNDYDYPEDIALDEFGNVYVTGVTKETATGENATTVKYDADGNVVWIAKYSTGNTNYAAAIASDRAGNIYVAGDLTDSAGNDVLVIKYSIDSNQPVWISTYDGPDAQSDSATDVEVDKFGNVYVAGITNYVGSNPTTSSDFLALKYSPDSNQPIWTAVYTGPPKSLDFAYKIAVDDSGNVIVGGNNEAMVTIKYSQCCQDGDINCDRICNCKDLSYLCDEWLMSQIHSDVAPPGGDGYVDFADWAAFAAAWKSQFGQPSYNPACDLVLDGQIDQSDMSAFIDEWLKMGYTSLWADIYPQPDGDGLVNIYDFALFAQQWMLDF